MTQPHLPPALGNLPQIRELIGGRKPAFFLDFDGTLAPIASRPESAAMPVEMRRVIASLARDHVVCIVSGRALGDLYPMIGLEHVYYAAEHGYRIMGPCDSGVDLEVGPEDRLELETAAYELENRLQHIAGAVVEPKGVSLSVHYRLVSDAERPLVRKIVAEVVESAPGLVLTDGKLVHELRPDMQWGKGRAVTWLLTRLRLKKREVCPICLGDDMTDEDMFAAVADRGIGVIVGVPGRPTLADYLLRDPTETESFLKTFTSRSG